MSGSPIPPIAAVMTPLPLSIALDARVVEARELMAEHDIRHPPVTEDGRLLADALNGRALGPPEELAG